MTETTAATTTTDGSHHPSNPGETVDADSDDSSRTQSLKVLRYLSLPEDYTPNPLVDPLAFLKLHLSILPTSLLQSTFTTLLPPRDRTKLVAIRNRRLHYHSTSPRAFSFPVARNKWVRIWDEDVAPAGAVLREDWRANARAEREEEEQWARGGFLRDKELVGERARLGRLLGDYEEERAGEIQRAQRRERLYGYRQEEEVLRKEKEEEDSSDEEEEEMREEDVVDGPINPAAAVAQSQNPYLDEERDSGENERLRRIFERTLKERFIDGILEDFDYDAVDWDDRWDLQSRDDEERWFDEEEEADVLPVPHETDLSDAPLRKPVSDSLYDY